MRFFMLLASASLGLSSCATVKSQKMDSVAADKSQANGLSYFLPARYMKITVTREALDPASLKAALDEKTKEHALAKSLSDAAEAVVKSKAERLASLPAGGDAAARAQATTELELAQADAALSTKETSTLKQTVDGLKKMLAAAQASGTNACSYSAKLELLPPQPDPRAHFVARPVHNPMRDDTTKLVVSDAGLLSSSNIVADDKTGQIITEIAGAIGGFGGGGGMTLAAPGEDAVPCVNLAKKFIRIFDPTRPEENPSIDLTKAKFPFLVEINRADGETLAATDLGEAGKKKSKHPPAIYYRSAVPLRVTVRECKPSAEQCGVSNSDVADEAMVLIPQAGPLSYIPMRSSAFVKTINDVQFENGSIKSWSADRPSEVLEVVRLPVKVLTSLISVPASMFQLRVNTTNNSKSLAEAQLGEIKAAERLSALQKCLLAAGDSSDELKLCLDK